MKKETFDLESLKDHALDIMSDAGFSIISDVAVELDPELPFMGYTIQEGSIPVIVVSGNALESGAALNLLIHELSHVYRSQNNHPSHNYQLLTDITAWVMHGKAVEPYQEQILHSILNHLQDLYADDISFKIFKKHSPDLDLSGFFMSWIHTPHKSAKTPTKIWQNADAMLSTAFAEANLERHKVVDTDGKVAKAVSEFLSQIDKPMAEKYEFFKNFMVLMPEHVTDKAFEKMLITYLSEFLKLTKN